MISVDRYLLSPVHDLRGPLHVLDVPAALRPRQEEETHDHEDRACLGRVVLHCRAALRPLDVGRTPGRHRGERISLSNASLIYNTRFL